VTVTAAMSTTWRSSLVSRKEAWLGGDKSLVVAVGNSGGDLDTIVSSIAAAHLLGGVAMVPFPRAELALRRDAVALLEFYGFFPQAREGATGSPFAPPELLYADDVRTDVDVDVDGSYGRKVALTDHNVLDRRLPHFGAGADVVAIFDHHADEGAHSDALPRDVDPGAGSASTLLGERLLMEVKKHKAKNANVIKSYTDASPPEELLAMVAAAIALDARGFDPAQKKYSRRDIRVADGLFDVLGVDKKPPPAEENDDDDDEAKIEAKLVDRLRQRAFSSSPLLAFKGAKSVVELAKALGEARHDVADLSAAQLLRMDYKQATVRPSVGAPFELGFAGILVDIDAFANKADDMKALLLDLAREKHLTLVVAMTAANKKIKPKRKSFLYLVAPPPQQNDDHGGLPPTFGADLEQALLDVPAGLPKDLTDLPLFDTQGIIDSGFHLSFADFSPGVRFSLVPKVITRKTMLPTLLHFAADLAAAKKSDDAPVVVVEDCEEPPAT